MSLRKIVLGTAMMSSVNVLRLLVQFFTIPLLARLLTPTDYGIIGIVMPFVLFIMMIADSGLGTSLVRTPADRREEWSTAFWLCVILGCTLGALMAALSPVIAYFYNEPQLLPIGLSLALIIPLQSLSLIPGAALHQARRFGLTAMSELASIGASIAAAVAVAYYGGGAWALVAQQLAMYSVRVVTTLAFSPFRPLFLLRLAIVKEHIIFGRNVLGVNLVGFITRAMDNLVIGKVLGTAAVGVYAMAFQFLRLPFMLITGPLQYVLYSQLAPSKDDKPLIRNTFLLLTRVLAIITFPVMGMVAAAQKPIFHILLSPKWEQVGRLFEIVMPVASLQAVTALGGTVLLVFGRTDIQLRTASEFGLVSLVSLLVFSHFGVEWVALGYSTLVLLYLPRSWSMVLPTLDCAPLSYLRSMVVPMLATVIAALAYKELAPYMGDNNWVHALAAAGLASLAIIASAAVQFVPLKNEFMALRR